MALPATAKEVVITRLSNKFREVTEIQNNPVVRPEAGKVLVKTKYVGINASDVNYSAGRYDPTHKAPMVAGLEGIGEIAAVGEGVTSLKVGQPVAYFSYGCFAEYATVPAKSCVPVPSVDPELLCIVLSGLTASVSLEREGDLKPGKTVLVTAASGGTGQFAVQIAKLAGCQVIGTCSGPEKCEFLKSIGCDRPVNYRTEDLNDVLSKEYPGGVDVVYECVGKDMLDAALKNVAVKGRVIIIGAVSSYEREDENDISGMVSKLPIAMLMLRKSASIRGFFLPHYAEDYPRHIATMAKQYAEGKLKIAVDKGEKSPKGPFVGLEKTVDAVEYMFSRQNIGKIMVQL